MPQGPSASVLSGLGAGGKVRNRGFIGLASLLSAAALFSATGPAPEAQAGKRNFRGTLVVLTEGLPEGNSVRIKISGPNQQGRRFRKTISRAIRTPFSGLRPGRYAITAEKTKVAGAESIPKQSSKTVVLSRDNPKAKVKVPFEFAEGQFDTFPLAPSIDVEKSTPEETAASRGVLVFDLRNPWLGGVTRDTPSGRTYSWSVYTCLIRKKGWGGNETVIEFGNTERQPGAPTRCSFSLTDLQTNEPYEMSVRQGIKERNLTSGAVTSGEGAWSNREIVRDAVAPSPPVVSGPTSVSVPTAQWTVDWGPDVFLTGGTAGLKCWISGPGQGGMKLSTGWNCGGSSPLGPTAGLSTPINWAGDPMYFNKGEGTLEDLPNCPPLQTYSVKAQQRDRLGNLSPVTNYPFTLAIPEVEPCPE